MKSHFPSIIIIYAFETATTCHCQSDLGFGQLHVLLFSYSFSLIEELFKLATIIYIT